MKTINILLCLFLLVITPAKAKQISFSKQSQGQQYVFNYQWLDHDNQPQAMSFALTQSALFERFRLLKSYQNEFAKKTVMRAVKKQVIEQPLDGAQVLFQKKEGAMVIQVKGLEDKNVALAYQKVKAIEQAAINAYFKNNYFQPFTTHDQKTGVKVDHVSIANDSVDDFKVLKTIILDKVTIENVREVTNYVLSFVQSIPYSPLESRLSSSGSGFNPPAKLLWENQGDCDSKMTLTATLLRALMPRISMAMIYMDKHAFIGIGIASSVGEIAIKHQGVNYLLAEPTGPALYPLGKIAPESELAITQGRYVVEVFHPESD